MTTLKNCAKCGRMFSAEPHQRFCSNCVENDDDVFKAVREYIYDHPSATIPDVSEALDVPEEKILKFLREGKLALRGDGVGLDCERCGKSIPSGRYCEQCSQEMKAEFNKAFGVKEPKGIEIKQVKKNTDSRGMFVKK